jgi:hypothetical protein
MKSVGADDEHQAVAQTAHNVGDLATPHRGRGLAGSLALGLVAKVTVVARAQELLHVPHHMPLRFTRA